MFAIIKTGGKQYRVEEGIYVKVEKLNCEPEKDLVIKEVLMIGNGDKTQIGNPYLNNASVLCEVVEQKKDKKIIVYKHKPKKGYQKKQGHRQKLTILKIKEIKF